MLRLSLGDVEIRVLFCLVEKERTTPAGYPMTVNALRQACNQKTSRDPVVEYDEPTIEHALARLKENDLVWRVHSRDHRATKYRHGVPDELNLADPELAVLCVLGLRGPQTAGELRSRTERLHAFADKDEVGEALERLAGRTPPLAVLMPRRPGQKEARWRQLLGGSEPDEADDDDWEDEDEVEVRQDDVPGALPATQLTSLVIGDLVARIERLEAAVEALSAALATIETRLDRGGSSG